MKRLKTVILIFLCVGILAACKTGCNCPAYSMSPSQNPKHQENKSSCPPAAVGEDTQSTKGSRTV